MQVRVTLGVAIVLAAILVACGGPASGGSPTRLSIATGGTGGVFYPYGGGVAKVLSAKLPGVEATAEVTAASVDNLKFLKQGTSDIAFTMADMALDGLSGREAFKDFGTVPLRALAVLYPSYTHLVVRGDSGIHSVVGLRGKVVSLGPAGAGSAVLGARILAAAGLDPARDIRSNNLSVAQAVDAMKDGKVDAFFWNGGIPTAAVLDLMHSPGITAKILPLDGMLPALSKAFGEGVYFVASIPKAVYDLPADVPVVAVSNLLVVSETMPETLAHDITKVLFDEQQTLASIHPQARDLALETAVKSTIPYHPGAVRFYRERNAWTQ